MTLFEIFPETAAPTMAKNGIRIPLEYGTVLLELLADLDGSTGQLPLLEGEAVGHRKWTPIERLAVDELRAQVDRALRFR